ncbi:MAG TPA: DUF362 domain-containing protein [Desulfomonilaceae bacterium]|nr:DUF362 domain-containing protein [Desulfomonilaceae bacterium]
MKHKVLIMRCDTYDPGKIAGIITDGLAELGVRPSGRILFKPNCVIAHPDLFPHAFTRREFLEGVVLAFRQAGEDIDELAVGERSGITVPTRFCFKNAGYNEIIRRHRLKTYYFDESRQVIRKLTSPERLRDEIFVPEPLVKSNFLVNLPKFKAHPWTRLTLSLKNFVGLQDDRHRLVDHNSFLEHKIADLQEIVQPSFIAVDAIVSGQKMMLTPTPFHMGAIVMGTNSCAVDTVCSHMVHVEPRDVVHLRLASERGFGPMRLDDIEITGDFPLEEVRARCTSFEMCMEHIDDYFGAEGNLTCMVGSFPEDHSPDYCWGGCPGALQEAMHIFKMYYPDVLQTMGRTRYVVGKIEGPLNLSPDEKVLFVGDCTSWEGIIDGKTVKIESTYRSTHEIDAHRTPSNDMLLKIMGSLFSCFVNRGSRYFHAKGCPVSVATHINYLSSIGNIRNVNFDRRNLIPINLAYWHMRFGRAYKNFFPE